MKPALNEIQDYLQTLAESHVELQHSAARKTYYRLTEDESSAIKTNAASPRMLVDHYSGRYTGTPEMLEKPVSITIKILVKADASEASKRAAYTQAEVIIDDIIAKLGNDMLTNCRLEGVQFTSITFDKIGPEGQNEFGYRLNIPFRQYGPSYNPQKWI